MKVLSLREYCKRFGIWVALAYAAAPLAHAAKFANQFVEFEAPPQWQCALEGAEWVCQNLEEAKKKDAIIVFAAKLKGDQDSLDSYQAYLKQPKTFTSLQGKSVTSEPKYTKVTDLNGTSWVDALHLESELPGYYTRYLATVHQDIGVLVTYSIHKNKYQDYSKDFEAMVKTLKVLRKGGGINTTGPGSLFDKVNIPNTMSEDTVFQANTPKGSEDPNAAAAKKPKQDDNDLMLYGAIAAIVGFILYRRKMNRG